MATRPTKAQAKAASAKLTGQQVTELVANADPEVTGRQMEGAGVVEPSVQDAEQPPSCFFCTKKGRMRRSP